MLVCHKIIDALLGKADITYHSKNVLNEASKIELAQMLRDAEKFDFGDIQFEVLDEISFLIPQLTEDEEEAWSSGLIPLPYPNCVFEVNTPYKEGNVKTVLFICQEKNIPTNWICIPFVVAGNSINFYNSCCRIFPSGNRIGFEISYPKTYLFDHDVSEEHKKESIRTNGDLVIYLTLMLYSKTTEKQKELAPPKLNKAREKKGKTKLFDHTIVRIVPQSFIDQSNREAIGTHKSPRLHWRRSHLRTYHRGEPDQYKIVIPRFLVGRADLGEVSHEYRVIGG